LAREKRYGLEPVLELAWRRCLAPLLKMEMRFRLGPLPGAGKEV